MESRTTINPLVGLLAAVALLAGFAGVGGGSTPLSGQNQAAATVLGDAQNAPPGFTGQMYPDYQNCWIIFDGKFPRGDYNAWTECGGYDSLAAFYSFYSGIFSISPAAAPTTGQSTYLLSTFRYAEYEVGQELGPRFSSYGCPEGYMIWGMGGEESVCRKQGTFNELIPATRCYAETGEGEDYFAAIGGGKPTSYSFPAGYNLSNGDKLDTGGSSGLYNFSKYKGDPDTCYAWKWLPDRLSSTRAAKGTPPAVAPGSELTMQWSCLPSRTVNSAGCQYRQFNSHCNPYTGVLYSAGTVSSGSSGSGPGFSPSGLTGTRTVTAPTTPGTYTYSLTCQGSWGLPAMTIPVVVGETATPIIGITGNGTNPVSVTRGVPVTIAGTYAVASGDTLLKTALNDSSNNALPGVAWTPPGNKSYVFDTAGRTPGTYVFYPAVQTTQYPGWNNYGKSLTVTITAATSTATCSGAHQINPPTCSCDIGYVMQGGVCTAATCSDPHAVPPLCGTCQSGYTRLGGACVVVPTVSLSLSQSTVRSGSPALLSWTAGNMPSDGSIACSISSTPASVFSRTMPAGTSPTWSGNDVATGAITQRTTFTLSCTNIGPVSVTVNLTPNVIEI